MEEQSGYLNDFKDFDWKNATHEDIIRFGKTLDFPEGGITRMECETLIKALEATGGKPLTILETGMCYGATTRIFIGWTLKYGGSVYSAEIRVRPLFKEKMEEAGYWQYVHPMGNSRHINWDPNIPIDFLFIDSEHALEDALGEYMKFRIYVPQMGIVGFHDYSNCPGVKMAVDIASFIDMFVDVANCINAGTFGLVLYRIVRHNAGGEYLSRAARLNEELSIYKARMAEKI